MGSHISAHIWFQHRKKGRKRQISKLLQCCPMLSSLSLHSNTKSLMDSHTSIAYSLSLSFSLLSTCPPSFKPSEHRMLNLWEGDSRPIIICRSGQLRAVLVSSGNITNHRSTLEDRSIGKSCGPSSLLPFCNFRIQIGGGREPEMNMRKLRGAKTTDYSSEIAARRMLIQRILGCFRPPWLVYGCTLPPYWHGARLSLGGVQATQTETCILLSW
jgi:hypothetical protein